ncbi:MAG: hypothetical protein KGS61_10720 [Verrucomicrobia bacterium]|nr:hypothetical protein [Verrucomicrobiota bacterium]
MNRYRTQFGRLPAIGASDAAAGCLNGEFQMHATGLTGAFGGRRLVHCRGKENKAQSADQAVIDSLEQRGFEIVPGFLPPSEQK